MVDAHQIRRFYNELAPNYASTINAYSAWRRAEGLGRFAYGRILEVACGSGAVTRALLDRGWVIAGDSALRMAAATSRTCGLPTLTYDAQAIPFADSSFDTVVCAEGLYYMRDVPAFLAESFRVLSPGGILAMSCLGTFWQRVSRARIRAGRLGVLPRSKVPFTSPIVPITLLKKWTVACGFTLGSVRRLMLLPWPTWHSVNRLIEATPLSRLGFTCLLICRKPTNQDRSHLGTGPHSIPPDNQRTSTGQIPSSETR